MGWGPIPWLLMSEIFPLHVKGVATGVCVLTNWLMAFLVTKEFGSLMVSTGAGGCPQQSAESACENFPRCRRLGTRGLESGPGPTWGTLAASVSGEGETDGPGRGYPPGRLGGRQQGGLPHTLDAGRTGQEVGLCGKTPALEWAGRGSNPAVAVSLLLAFSEPASLAENRGG